MSNRRRSERFEVALPIWLKDGHGGERTETANVSSHGIAVFSGRARPLRQYIELEIQLPAPSRNINVTAVVARHAEFVKTDTGAQTAGLGLDFFLFDASAKSRWQDFLTKMRDEGTDFIPRADEIVAASESPNPLPERAKPPTELELTADDDVEEKPTFIIKPRDLGRLWAFYRGELAKGRVRIETPVAKPDGSEVELLVVHPTSRAEWTLAGYVAETKSRGERGKRPVLEINLVEVTSDLKAAFRNFVATGQGMIEEDVEIGDDSSSVQPAEPPRLESVVIDLDALDESSIDLPSGIVDPPPPLPEWSTDDLEEVADESPAPYRAEPPTPSIRPPLSLVAATRDAPTEEPRPITSDLEPPPPGEPAPKSNVLTFPAAKDPSEAPDSETDAPVRAAEDAPKPDADKGPDRLLELDDVRTSTAQQRARAVAVDADPTLPAARAVASTPEDDAPTEDDGIEASFEDMFFASGLKREAPRVEDVPHVEDEPTVTPSMPPFTPAPLASAPPTRSVFASFFEEAAASHSDVESPPTPVPDDDELDEVVPPPPIVSLGRSALDDLRDEPRFEDERTTPERGPRPAALSPSQRRAASGARRISSDGVRAAMGIDDRPDSSATEVRDPSADLPRAPRERPEDSAAANNGAPRLSEAEQAVLRLPTSAILTSRPSDGAAGVRVYGPRDERASGGSEGDAGGGADRGAGRTAEPGVPGPGDARDGVGGSVHQGAAEPGVAGQGGAGRGSSDQGAAEPGVKGRGAAGQDAAGQGVRGRAGGRGGAEPARARDRDAGRVAVRGVPGPGDATEGSDGSGENAAASAEPAQRSAKNAREEARPPELPDWVVPRSEALVNPPRPPSKSPVVRGAPASGPEFPVNVPVPPGSMFDFEEEASEERELPVKPAPGNRPNRRPPPLPPSARRAIRNPVEREHVGHKNVSTQGVDPDLDRDIGLARARVVRSPHSVTACYRLSMLLMQRGEGNGVGEALESLKKVMTLEPNHPGAHHKIAELLARKGDYALAAEHLGRARRLGYRIDPDLERIVTSGAKSS